jgi:hypothetical protein
MTSSSSRSARPRRVPRMRRTRSSQGGAPATFKGDKRSKAGVEVVTALGLDIDTGAAAARADARGVRDGARRCSCTPRAATRPTVPRWRVVLAVSRPMTSSEHIDSSGSSERARARRVRARARRRRRRTHRASGISPACRSRATTSSPSHRRRSDRRRRVRALCILPVTHVRQSLEGLTKADRPRRVDRARSATMPDALDEASR